MTGLCRSNGHKTLKTLFNTLVISVSPANRGGKRLAFDMASITLFMVETTAVLMVESNPSSCLEADGTVNPWANQRRETGDRSQ